MPGTALSNLQNVKDRRNSVKESPHSDRFLRPAVAAPIDISPNRSEPGQIPAPVVLESHHTGFALMRALKDTPAAPNAATPRQAWALTAAIAAIFIAFVIGWTFFGLPAPALPVPD